MVETDQIATSTTAISHYSCSNGVGCVGWMDVIMILIPVLLALFQQTGAELGKFEVAPLNHV